MIKLVIALAAASGLAATLLQQLSRKHQARSHRDEGHRHRDDVSRWEAEGGNLPPAPPKNAAVPRRRTAAKRTAVAG
jgi:Ni/Co efflux regulator RcnB